MSVLLARVAVVPVWLIAVGLVALALPPSTVVTALALLVSAVIIVPVVIIILAVRRRPDRSWPANVRRLWHTVRRDRAVLAAEIDARGLVHMDGDKR
jgi:flagellar biosynthesis protein FliP